MTLRALTWSIAGIGSLTMACGAFAQTSADALIEIEQIGEPAQAPDNIQETALEPAAPTEPAINPDEMADQLNGRQQLQQTVTLKRTINGEVVEREKRTITYKRGAPYRETEAGQSPLEALKTAFDGELLTRLEAFEEAKIDFTVADTDRNGLMTQEEFSALVESWRESGQPDDTAANREIARQRQYEAFLAEIDPAAAETPSDSPAVKKFKFMAGAADTVSRMDYIREYLLDFDAMDADKDTLLKDVELVRFRALNRGESLG